MDGPVMTPGYPPILCIVGRKNAGKTGLTVALAGELNRRGFRVMTVKQGHGFQVDQAGKDSWRHRHEGGAIRTVLSGPRDFAVVGRWPRERMSLREVVDRFLSDADIVLAEGAKGSAEPRIEVFRRDLHDEPLFTAGDPERGRTLALLTDDPELEVPMPVFPLDDPRCICAVADLVVEALLTRRGPV